jgi:hypothetical protein
MADNLTPSTADVMESGSLNLSEPSGPHRLVTGKLYLYLFYYSSRFKRDSVLEYWKPENTSFKIGAYGVSAVAIVQSQKHWPTDLSI